MINIIKINKLNTGALKCEKEISLPPWGTKGIGEDFQRDVVIAAMNKAVPRENTVCILNPAEMVMNFKSHKKIYKNSIFLYFSVSIIYFFPLLIKIYLVYPGILSLFSVNSVRIGLR